ncbi:MAG: ATP-binding protein [Nitrospinae bacterium]|nr:ATP-binding protein [Nitrospinota bacterium]MBF0634747.1 ATP-binding protein [Nitrospinota bacterium]
MTAMQKGRSPFYPGQPVPVELFVGRAEQINRIIERGVNQVKAGKPMAFFIQGEYGIGKSSIASFIQRAAEQDHGLHGINVALGGRSDLNGVAEAILEATLKSGAFNPSRVEKITGWLAKYVGKQTFAGITVNFEALKKDAPNISTPIGMLDFLGSVRDHLKDDGIKGVFLVLDEINGIASNPQFAHFIKSLWDTNAISREPLPFLLMLCGVEERRMEMIGKHEPINRIFDVVDINALTKSEVEEFFQKTFQSVQIQIESGAMGLLIEHSSGMPKIMHEIGDAAFWTDTDGVIDRLDTFSALKVAAEAIGKKYVDQQVYNAIKSKDYHSILNKIAEITSFVSVTFKKTDVLSTLTETEKGKFNNFLTKMRELNVIKPGGNRGEYMFTVRMVHLYILMQSQKKK